MNHKRKRPKNRRGGCLLCKSWKANGSELELRDRPGVRRYSSAMLATSDSSYSLTFEPSIATKNITSD